MDVIYFCTQRSFPVTYQQFLGMSDHEKNELAIVANSSHPEYTPPIRPGLYRPDMGNLKETVADTDGFCQWLDALSFFVHAVPLTTILQTPGYAGRAFYELLNWDATMGYGYDTATVIGTAFSNYENALDWELKNNPDNFIDSTGLTYREFAKIYNHLRLGFSNVCAGTTTGFILIYAGDIGLPSTY